MDYFGPQVLNMAGPAMFNTWGPGKLRVYNNDIIQSTNFDLKSFRFGFEAFPFILMVLVSKNCGIGKSIGIGIGKNVVSKKVSDSVSF